MAALDVCLSQRGADEQLHALAAVQFTGEEAPVLQPHCKRHRTLEMIRTFECDAQVNSRSLTEIRRSVPKGQTCTEAQLFIQIA